MSTNIYIMLGRLFTLLIFFICFSAKAQTSVGVLNGTLTVIPSNTVSSGTTISIKGSIVNTGSTSISDYLHINLAIDTSSTGIPKYYWRSTVTYSVTNFLPLSTQTFVITDVASYPNKYHCCGDGTTVIIWPLIGNPTNTISTHDTASTVVYVTLPTTNTNEIVEFENTIIKIQNPLTENIIINYNQQLCSKIELVTINGQIIENAVLDNILHISNLSKGMYFLNFYISSTRIITKKIIIE